MEYHKYTRGKEIIKKIEAHENSIESLKVEILELKKELDKILHEEIRRIEE